MKSKFKLLPILLIMLINVKYVYPQNEFLDQTLGHGGIVKTAINTLDTENQSNSAVFQSDGKIVAAGFYINYNSKKSFALVRYNPDGSLDYSFGINGIVTTPIGDGDCEIYSLAIQKVPGNNSEEKIIAAGYANVQFEGNNFAMARYNSDGSIDNTFGNDGTGNVITIVSSLDDAARSVVIQNDGKIILTGSAKFGNNNDFAIVRYNPNGILDENFGSDGGIIKLDVSGNSKDDFAYSAAIQDDGKIVIVGFSATVIGTQIVHYNSDFVLVRYNTDGTLDSDFGANGTGTVITPGISDFDYAYSVVVQKDSKIVIGGTSKSGNDYDFALLRYTSNGMLDNTFNDSGMVVTQAGSGDNQIKSIALQQMDDGTESILAAGFYFNGNDYDYTIERYKSTGELEGQFGGSSEHIIPGKAIKIGESDDKALSMSIKKNPANGNIEKIVLAGFANNGTNNDFALACLNPDGTVDTSFGTNGTMTTKMGEVESEINALALQTINGKEKIIAAGYAINANDKSKFDFALVRYKKDGTLDNSFGVNGNGIVTTSIGGYDKIHTVVLQGDGKIIAGGQKSHNEYDAALIRYNPDGIIDSSFGINGNGIVNPPIQITSALLQNDGKIVIAGGFDKNNTLGFSVARYNNEGNIDNTFGLEKDGMAYTPIKLQKNALALSAAIQSDGKTIVAGSYLESTDDNDIALARFNADGTLDNSFGEKGIVTTKIDTANDFGVSVAIQNDNKIVIGGGAIIGNDYDFVLVRYNTDGSLDDSFGEKGIVTTPQTGTDEIITSIKIQEENGVEKINAAGYIIFNSGEAGQRVYFNTARYNSDGSIDNSFGTNGQIITVTNQTFDAITSMILQKDGKIIAGGYTQAPGGDRVFFTLSRYNSFKITSIENQISERTPSSFSLEQNYPNPFNPSTTIKYSILLPNVGNENFRSVQLIVYDILGREVATLVNKNQPSGNYEVNFNASRLSSGVYFYSLKAGDYSSLKKMILLK